MDHGWLLQRHSSCRSRAYSQRRTAHRRLYSLEHDCASLKGLALLEKTDTILYSGGCELAISTKRVLLYKRKCSFYKRNSSSLQFYLASSRTVGNYISKSFTKNISYYQLAHLLIPISLFYDNTAGLNLPSSSTHL